MRHWIRMWRWARNPPSKQQRMIVLVVMAVALLLAGIEFFFGWPDWLTVNRPPRVRVN